MDIREEIRARLPIDQLVAQYRQLTRKGRNYVCLCPFHNDTHPSFLVSPDKGIAYCFACQTGGDIFAFFQKIENVDFPTALKMLAEKAGVEIPKENFKSTGPSKDEKERIRMCLEAAMQFYQSNLRSSEAAKAYIEKRIVPVPLLEKFAIGYAPDGYSVTYEHLLKCGFSKSEVLAAGLGIQRELQDERILDRFRNRIMFPITDAQGAVIGFGGRDLGGQDAKYINSPEGLLYHKSSVLFGLHQAREAIRKTKQLILVEGYFDTVACHKAGIENVVAASGTALTEDHVRLIKRYADSVILCLDMDEAGQKAADRAFQLLSRADIPVLTVRIPSKDPDELAIEDPSKLAHILQHAASPYIEVLLSEISPSMNDIERKTYLDRLFPLLASLSSSLDLRSAIEKIAPALKVLDNELLRDFTSWKAREQQGKRAAISLPQEHLFASFELCIGLALLYPKQREFLRELIALDEKIWEAVRLRISSAPASESSLDILATIDVPEDVRERLRIILLYCEESFPIWSDSLASKETKKLLARANKDILVRKQAEVITKLKDAKLRGRKDEEDMLLTTYQQILKLSKMVG